MRIVSKISPLNESLEQHWEDARTARCDLLAELTTRLGSDHAGKDRSVVCNAGEWHDYDVMLEDVREYCGNQ